VDKLTTQNLDQLESVLNDSVHRQAQLLALLERKRLALREGRAQDMADLCCLENTLVQAISELEKRRLQLVADVTLAVVPGADSPLKMRDLAERLPEPHRGRLLVTRTKLVVAIEKVAEQTSVVRRRWCNTSMG